MGSSSGNIKEGPTEADRSAPMNMKKFTAGGSAVSTSHTGQKPCAAQMRSVLTEQPAASDTVKKFRNATSEGKKASLGFPILPVKSLMWL